MKSLIEKREEIANIIYDKKLHSPLKVLEIEAIVKKEIDLVIDEVIEKVKRIKLDMDIVVCDCGEPYKDSDPANLINDLIQDLKKLKS